MNPTLFPLEMLSIYAVKECLIKRGTHECDRTAGRMVSAAVIIYRNIMLTNGLKLPGEALRESEVEV